MRSTCVICSTEFTLKKGSKAKTCSPSCREKYRIQRTVEASVKSGAWVTHSCAVCGKEFTRRKGKAGIVCSIECRAVRQQKEAKAHRTCTESSSSTRRPCWPLSRVACFLAPDGVSSSPTDLNR